MLYKLCWVEWCPEQKVMLQGSCVFFNPSYRVITNHRLRTAEGHYQEQEVFKIIAWYILQLYLQGP